MKSTSAEKMKKLANTELLLLIFVLAFSSLIYTSNPHKSEKIIKFREESLCNISGLFAFPQNNDLPKLYYNLLSLGMNFNKICLFSNEDEKNKCIILYEMGFFDNLIPYSLLASYSRSLLYISNIKDFKEYSILIFGCNVYLIRGNKIENII